MRSLSELQEAYRGNLVAVAAAAPVAEQILLGKIEFERQSKAAKPLLNYSLLENYFKINDFTLRNTKKVKKKKKN